MTPSRGLSRAAPAASTSGFASSRAITSRKNRRRAAASGVAHAARVHGCGQDAVAVEAHVRAAQVGEAHGERARDDEQRHRSHHLDGDQRAADARGAGRASRAGGAPAQERVDGRRADQQQRDTADPEGQHHETRGGEQERPAIDGSGRHPRDAVRRECDHRVQHRDGETDPRDGAERSPEPAPPRRTAGRDDGSRRPGRDAAPPRRRGGPPASASSPPRLMPATSSNTTAPANSSDATSRPLPRTWSRSGVSAAT